MLGLRFWGLEWACKNGDFDVLKQAATAGQAPHTNVHLRVWAADGVEQKQQYAAPLHSLLANHEAHKHAELSNVLHNVISSICMQHRQSL